MNSSDHAQAVHILGEVEKLINQQYAFTTILDNLNRPGPYLTLHGKRRPHLIIDINVSFTKMRSIIDCGTWHYSGKIKFMEYDLADPACFDHVLNTIKEWMATKWRKAKTDTSQQ